MISERRGAGRHRCRWTPGKCRRCTLSSLDHASYRAAPHNIPPANIYRLRRSSGIAIGNLSVECHAGTARRSGGSAWNLSTAQAERHSQTVVPRSPGVVPGAGNPPPSNLAARRASGIHPASVAVPGSQGRNPQAPYQTLASLTLASAATSQILASAAWCLTLASALGQHNPLRSQHNLPSDLPQVVAGRRWGAAVCCLAFLQNCILKASGTNGHRYSRSEVATL